MCVCVCRRAVKVFFFFFPLKGKKPQNPGEKDVTSIQPVSITLPCRMLKWASLRAGRERYLLVTLSKLYKQPPRKPHFKKPQVGCTRKRDNLWGSVWL